MAKPGSHKKIQGDQEVWEILNNGGVQQYLKNFQGHDPTLEYLWSTIMLMVGI